MNFLPAIGGMGAATILGTFFNKLTPAAIMWQPQGTRAPVEPTPEGTSSPVNAGTIVAGAVDSLLSPIKQGIPSWESGSVATAKSLVFHCSVAETFSVSNSVTKFPVDSGFSVSDHTIRQNPIIQIEGVVSNTPMSTMDITSLAGIIQIGSAILGNPLGGVLNSAIGLGKALTGGSQKADADYFHETLEMLVTTGQMVSVSTLRGVYDNCVVTAYNTRADVDTSSSLHFSITLEKLYVVRLKDAEGGPINQANQALTSLTTLGQQKIKGYINAIGIGAIGAAKNAVKGLF